MQSLPRDAMQARPMPSCGVCVSVSFRQNVRTWQIDIHLSRSYILSKRINSVFNIFSPFIHTKRHDNIPTGPPPPNGVLNAGGVGRNRDSEPISGLIACCQRCDRLVVINTVPPDRDKLWHLSQVVSGGACWWRETFTTRSFNITPKTATFNCTQWFNLQRM